MPDPGTLTLGYAPDADDAFRFYPHVLLNAGRFGSRERQRVDQSPLAGARGYGANHSPNLLGDLNYLSVGPLVARSVSEWSFG